MFVVRGWLLAVFPRPETSGASSPVTKRTSEKEPSAADRRNKVAQTDGLFLSRGETALAILSALPQRRFCYPVEGPSPHRGGGGGGVTRLVCLFSGRPVRVLLPGDLASIDRSEMRLPPDFDPPLLLVELLFPHPRRACHFLPCTGIRKRRSCCPVCC